MNGEEQVRNSLSRKFDRERSDRAIAHFLACVQKFEQSDWENSLSKAGKFAEAIVKLLWIYCGKSLPAQAKDFKAGVYAQKIINEVDKKTVPENEIRLQIPRASILIYDITSNRGARHDAEELDPNEMDATVTLSICSWILAELVRFSGKDSIGIDDAKRIVDSLIQRRYPIFEAIDGRIYVDDRKYKSAQECVLLVLYALFPKRANVQVLVDSVERHGYKTTAFKFQRLKPYVDIDENGNLLLRANGRKKAEQILNRGN